MIQRAIPSSGETIPVVGIGSWLKFDIGDHSTGRQDLEDILRLMHQQGARLIDSSPMYGRAEEMIGKLTTKLGLADKFFFATKVWTSGREAGIRQMKESLKKMKRPVMDL